jgi:hypothetical protein
MVTVRVGLCLCGSDTWGYVFREVELPAVFPGLLIQGIRDGQDWDPEPLGEILFDVAGGMLSAELPDHEDKDRTFAELMAMDYTAWTVEWTRAGGLLPSIAGS